MSMQPAELLRDRIDLSRDPRPFAQILWHLRPDLQPACPDCLDLGFIHVPSFDRRDQGGLELCECQKRITRSNGKPPFEYYDAATNAMAPCPSRPARLALDRIRRLERWSGIPGRYHGKFLEDVEPCTNSLQDALDAAVNSVAEFRSPELGRGLYLWGDTGCGKTLIGCAALNEILRLYQRPVRYAKISRDILGKLRSSFNPASESYGEGRRIEEELAGVEALVIDDFGTHKETEWVNQVLYDLIDARYENNLLTIVTSNEPLENLKEIAQGRIYSRLKGMTTEIHIEAPDYRLGPGQ